MKHPRLLWLISLAASAVFVAGCGQKVTIKTTNGNVTGTVDTGKNTANINVNGSTIGVGEKVSLPSDYPSDIYIISGTIKSAISTPSVGSTVGIAATPTVAESFSLYKQKLSANGWTLGTTAAIDAHSSVVTATKDTRFLTVAISDVDGPTMVILTVQPKSVTDPFGY